MAPLAAFVEKTREQYFREPVSVVFVTDVGFAAQVRILRTRTVRGFATELAFRSVGFPAPPTLAGASQLRDFALYDAAKKRVVVRGDRLEPGTAPDVVVTQIFREGGNAGVDVLFRVRPETPRREHPVPWRGTWREQLPRQTRQTGPADAKVTAPSEHAT